MDDTKIDSATRELLERMRMNGTRASASSTAPTPPSSSGAVNSAPSTPPLNPLIPQLGGPTQPPLPPAGSSGGGNGSSNQPKGNILKKLDFNSVMMVLFLVASVFAALYTVPASNAFLQSEWFKKSIVETQAEAEKVKAEEQTKQLQEIVKIVKMTGKAPANFTAPLPTVQSPAQEVQMSSQAVVQQESNQYPHGVITVPIGQRISLAEGMPFSFESNASGPSATIMSRHTIKSIDGGGEYKLVHVETGNETSWSTASGQIPAEVRSFLEAHRMTVGHPESMELYTRNGRVIFNL